MRESMAPDDRARWAALLSANGQMSIDELLALPEHRWRYELIAGQLTQRPPNDLLYDMMVRMLVSAVRDFVRTAGIGGTIEQETGVAVSATGDLDTVFVPALAFFRSGHAAVSDSPAEISSVHLVPAFVVEIAAPGQARPALAERARTWLGAGTQVVWVIWPAYRQVDIWRARRDGQTGEEASPPKVTTRNVHEMLEAEDALPGFSYPAAYFMT